MLDKAFRVRQGQYVLIFQPLRDFLVRFALLFIWVTLLKDDHEVLGWNSVVVAHQWYEIIIYALHLMAIFVQIRLVTYPRLEKLWLWVCSLFVIQIFLTAKLSLDFSKCYLAIVIVDTPRFKVHFESADLRVLYCFLGVITIIYDSCGDLEAMISCKLIRRIIKVFLHSFHYAILSLISKRAKLYGRIAYH